MHPADDGLTLAVSVRPDGEIVVAVAGEIDMATAGRLRDAIEPYLGPRQRLVLDMSEVAFMDSSCLAVLVQTNSVLRGREGQLVVRDPSRPARQVLTLSELAGIIDEFDGGRA